MAERAAFDLDCFRGPGDRPGPDITSALVTDDGIGAAVGKEAIARDWHVVEELGLTFYHVPGVHQVGQIVTIQSSISGIQARKVAIETLSGVFSIGDNRAIYLAYAAGVESYSDPAVGYGS